MSLFFCYCGILLFPLRPGFLHQGGLASGNRHPSKDDLVREVCVVGNGALEEE
jgi:hypothetical protein